MGPALPAGIPPLEETSYSRERILDALRHEVELPSAAIAVATLYANAIEADVIAVLERARHEDLDEASERLLFRGIHILGGRRLPAAYRSLLALLRGPQARVECQSGRGSAGDPSTYGRIREPCLGPAAALSRLG